jgi:hypothetical protein
LVVPIFGGFEVLGLGEAVFHFPGEHGVDFAALQGFMDPPAEDAPGTAEALLVEANDRVMSQHEKTTPEVQGEDF